MKCEVNSLDNKKVKDMTLNKDIFGLDLKEEIIYRMVRYQLSKKRSGNHKTKGISEISGTTKKPFKQKGTGRARAGTIRSPIWVGGGATFANVKNYEKKINKKMAKKALASILSKFKAEKRLQLVEDVSFKEPKTKLAEKYFEKSGLSSALLITNDADENTMLAIRNLKNFSFLDASEISPFPKNTRI